MMTAWDVECPKCGAGPGYACRWYLGRKDTRTGLPLWGPVPGRMHVWRGRTASIENVRARR